MHITDEDPYKKQIPKLIIRLEVDEGATVTVSMRFDSTGDWETVDTLAANVKRSYYLPIVPRRADHYRIRLSGTGGCRVYSIAREYSQGSALKSQQGRN